MLNELSWEDGPDPRLWQPNPTVFEVAERAGVDVTRVGPGYFDGSGADRGGGPGRPLRRRRPRSPSGSTRPSRRCAGHPRPRATSTGSDVDKVGHVEGPDSWQWGDALETVDRELARLAASLPDDARSPSPPTTAWSRCSQPIASTSPRTRA